MKLNLTLTERDKKLLLILAVVIIASGLGGGIVLPLMNKNMELQSQVSDARMEQIEKQQDVLQLPAKQQSKEQAEEHLLQNAEQFYSMMSSVEIDKLLTEMALKENLVIRELNITMPPEDAYTTLSDYEQMVGIVPEGEDKDQTYPGIYTVSIRWSLMGERDVLWNLLDMCNTLTPKLQVIDFLIQDGRNEDGATTILSINLNLYMVQDVQQYIEEQQNLLEEAESQTE